MKKWDRIPQPINNEKVLPYYILLKRKLVYRFVKRTFDIVASLLLMVLLFIPSLIIGLVIIFDSKGGMFFCQTRVGRYGKSFKIIKFRTMRSNSEGEKHITSKDDNRITKVGCFLRKTHWDEFPQLLNVFIGQMSFVGARPEVEFFVNYFNDEWFATLLMRPGVTSTSSYCYEDEAKYIGSSNYNEAYIGKVLPFKMEKNLDDLKSPSIFLDIKILWKTVF